MARKPKPAPGSVYPNGRGKFVAQEPMNAEGKRPSETFDTEAEGWEHLKQVYARSIIRRGRPIKVSAIPLRVVLADWVESRIVKESTKDSYRTQLRPVLRHPDSLIPLGEITDLHVETLIKAASPGNARLKVFYRLGPFFRWATQRGYVPEDPFVLSQAENLKDEAEGIAETQRLPTTGKAWTLDEMRATLASINRPYFRALVAFMLVTGVRRGEALGLSWGAVDGCTALIRRNRTAGSSKSVIVEALPKTKRPRVAQFGPHLAAMIEALRPADWQPDDYVFVSQKFGKPLTPSVVGREVRRLADRLGIEAAGATHALRRTFATVLDEANCPVVIRETLLGHAGSRYAVARPGVLKDWAEIADKLFLDGID